MLLLFAMNGCDFGSDELKRYAMSGTVTYDGKPIPFGEITFTPDTTQGNSGPGAVATILEGAYHVTGEKGLIGGPHVISITGYTGVPDNGAVMAGTASQPKPLFARYSTSDDLPLENTTLDVEVPKKR
ncbi:hypothetical protein M4951_02670 [Blastopirellula sp. J2-11]|uniref:hypothetical protein n=1 Tax=Blastopirellula sp. J2-11 TaxID=2943192 RepID=UPI0021C7E9DD|nr:hypothetical protein [Blastopirellula sp. J2-11]UUO07221.1 hypothetical protein M4951_02670 [Blastopirellula sp. J2-11]